MRRLRPLALLGLLLALIGLFGSLTPPAALAAPSAQSPTELTIFAAASLSDAFREIGRSFEKANPGVKLVFNFAGSQQLAAQLGQGAPADLFASANATHMNVAVTANRVAKDAAKTFVQNRLVVVTPQDNRARITTLQDLAKPGVKLVVAARAVPVGQYTLDFLDKAVKDKAFASDYKTRVLANVVSYEDNVRSVLTKVALGEGDAGVVYTSDVISSPKTPVRRISIPTALNVIASYPIAPISDSKQADLAQKFVRFVFAGDSRLVLVKYGFSLP